LENAVNNGRISLERLDESVRKILAAKRWLKIEDQKIVDLPSVSKLISENPYSPLSKKIAEESITLLKNDDNLLPLKLNKYKNVFCITLTDSYWSRRAEYFQTIFEHRVGEITNHVLTSKDKRKEYNQILNELDNADLIIIPSFIDVKTYQGPVNLSVEQIDFIAGVLRKNISTILISFRNPYLIYLFPEAKTYLNSFSHSYPSQDAMLRSLLGEIDIKGKLPITIPDTKLSYGSGIELHKSFQSVLKYEFLSENKTKSVDEKINDAISENILPGAVVLFAKRGKIIYQKAFGKNSFGNISFFIEKDEIVNLGRLTNLFTIAVAIQLIDEGVIRLDDKLSDYFENIFSATKSKIETKNLIVQNSGYGSEINSKFYTWEKEELIQNILRQDLDYEPGEKYLYSNLNLVILQHLLEKQAGMNLDEMINKKLIGQLGITSTGFNYENLNKVRISEYNNSNYNLPLVKTNDDVMLEILNGIAGFDGLYSNAFDLAVLSQMLLQKGYYNDMQILKAPSVENWFKGFKENEEIDSTKKKIEIIDLRGCAVSINFENESFMIILSNADIRNPSNTKFADFSENLLKIFNEEISKGIL
jgi:CubicO group peptidase (beta-lactamase class C family)